MSFKNWKKTKDKRDIIVWKNKITNDKIIVKKDNDQYKTIWNFGLNGKLLKKYNNKSAALKRSRNYRRNN